ncbi:hypothetical protein [Nostoc sp.]|uniref:hypothetical protein n=1 Tax=Nostoc sp. TaxID=1180 RepID=UPI002FF80F03
MRNHRKRKFVECDRNKADDGNAVVSVFPSLRPRVGASYPAAKLSPTEHQSYQGVKTK